MISTGAIPLALPVGLAVLVAALLAFLIAHRMAHSARLIDVPGPRSSHTRPTPRGGGIGIVLVGLVAIGALAIVNLWPLPWLPTLGAFALVAAIGVLDDIRHRPVLLRLAAHAAAAAMLVVPLAQQWYGAWIAGPAAGLAVAGLVWSTNLHNFMDGIDGLLAHHAIWAGLVYATLFAFAVQPAPALFAVLLAAAAIGFLPMNWPRAKVFLGDGASGYIGLVVGWLALYGMMRGVVPLPESLIVLSAFLIDSGATLAVRILRRERFWQAHREHLYQRLVRRGQSHLTVSAMFAAWNLGVAVPALLLARNVGVDSSWRVCAAVFALGMIVWLVAVRASRQPTTGPG